METDRSINIFLKTVILIVLLLVFIKFYIRYTHLFIYILTLLGF